MAIDVKIPPMGESITSGVLAKWHVKDGDLVKKDQPLFELETDKITSEGTAEVAGKISYKLAAGTEVKIGQVVASIDESATAATPQTPDAKAQTPVAAEAATSPAVRRLAEETGVDPASVKGSGKAGRVTKGDMLAAGTDQPTSPVAKPQDEPRQSPDGEGGPSAATAPAVAPSEASAKEGASPPAQEERQTRTKLSKLRQTIARRLVAAQHEAAMLTTFNECDMSAVMALRTKYQDVFVKKHGVKLGFMSFFTKAVVQALKEVPAINAQLDGDDLITNHYFDIGMAVSTDKGLMVPVIRDCDSLGMADIEKALADVAKRARESRITLSDLEGGVFTITNGGTFGSMLSTPILNAPQSAILGLHAINERPVAVNGQVVIRPMMYLALSYDHRVVDGKQAVTFLVKVKEFIEDPTRLVIGI